MAHSLSAKKRVRQNEKSRLRNRRRNTALRSTIKSFLNLVQHGKVDEAEKALPKVCQAIDKVAAKGTLHKNTASRYKSRLSRRLNGAKKPAAA